MKSNNQTLFPAFNSQKALSKAVSRLYEMTKDQGVLSRSHAQELLAQVLGAPNYNVLLAQTLKAGKGTESDQKIGTPATVATTATSNASKGLEGDSLLKELATLATNHTCELLSDVYCIDPREQDAPNWMALTITPALISELCSIYAEVVSLRLSKSSTLLRVTTYWSGKGVWKESNGSHDLDEISWMIEQTKHDELRVRCPQGFSVFARDVAKEEDHDIAHDSTRAMENFTLEVAVDGTFRLSGCPRHWDEDGRCFTPWIPLSMLKANYLFANRRDPAFK